VHRNLFCIPITLFILKVSSTGNAYGLDALHSCFIREIGRFNLRAAKSHSRQTGRNF